MKKKIVSLTLVLALCLSLLPVTAFAEGDDEASTEVKTWGDLADTSWYTGNEDAAEYHITTAAQLAGLAELINKENAPVSFDGKIVYLDNDLDLAGHEWISIGNGLAIQNANQHDPDWYYSFNGTFDGQGHVIYNLYSHDSLLKNEDNFVDGSAVATPHGRDVYKTGLFGQIYEGTVKNLGVANADIWIHPDDVSTYGEGILVDYLDNSAIENCWTTGSIIGGSCVEKYIGGLVGTTLKNCTISGCYSSAEIIGNYGTSSNIYSSSDQMRYYDSLGGIVGGPIYGGNITIKDCWFDGKITVNSIQAAVGGIAGASNADIENCLVISEDIEKDPVEDDQNTCWVGYLFSGSVKNCFWPDDNKYPSSTLNDDGQGVATSDFTSASVLEGLTTNAGTGITWVAGITHPTFEWDKWHISADYTEVDKAITAAEAIDGSLYSNYSDVEAAIKAVDRTKSKAEQAKVDAMAEAITNAINSLVRKPTSSSGSSRPRYDVTTPSKPENGSVTVDPERARSGSRVTVTVTPDSGYKLGELVVTDKDGKKLELTDKGNGQYTFTMPSGKVEVAAEFVKEVEVSPFADVATDAYYYDAVKWAVEKGVTNGVSETLFGPDQACTRAQIVTFLWRAAGSPEPKSGSSFADVAADAYYAKAVAWAVENGITKGTSETTFHPDETCTRAQGVTFLYRALGKLAAAQAGFTDVSADSYYADAVNWAAENGVTKGISETLFGPDGSCTRAQIVTFLYRAYQGK